MNTNELEISVETIVDTLANRIAVLEKEKAMLIAQIEAIAKKQQAGEAS